MAFTYLNSKMIEVPAAVAELSAQILRADNLIVRNIQTSATGNDSQWNQAYTNVTANSAFWQSSSNTVRNLSATWNTTTSLATALNATLNTKSVDWDSVYSTTRTLSSNWNVAYNTISALSGNWESSYKTVDALSANWSSVYTTVCALSTSWEETADILPTVTNYLSTNNVLVKDVTLGQNGGTIFNNAEIFGNVTIYGTLSALSGAQIFQGVTTTVASSLSVQNYGPGPALYVFQDSCLESIAIIKDANGSDVLTINNVVPDQGQDGVKVYFTGQGNTFVVSNSSNNTAFVVTSAGNIKTTGQILSGDIPLHDIFLTPNEDSQILSYIPSSYELSISNGNTVNLGSINSTFAATSGNFQTTYNTVCSLSGNWESTYTTFANTSANYIVDGGNLPSTDSLLIGTNNSKNLRLQANNQTQVTITSSGSIGIGTTNPSPVVKLTITGDVSAVNGTTTFDSNSNTPTVVVRQTGLGNALNITGNVTTNGNISASNSFQTPGGDSNNWNSTYAVVCALSSSWEESTDITALTTILQSGSANWDSTYAIVSALSASWEESANVLPTITNYLSTNVIEISTLNVTQDILSGGTNLLDIFAVADYKVNIVNATSSVVFTDTDTGKIYHFDTTSGSLCAIFETAVLTNGFNITIVNTGTQNVLISSNNLKSIGTTISEQYGSVYVYTFQNDVFAIGRLI